MSYSNDWSAVGLLGDREYSCHCEVLRAHVEMWRLTSVHIKIKSSLGTGSVLQCSVGTGSVQMCSVGRGSIQKYPDVDGLPMCSVH